MKVGRVKQGHVTELLLQTAILLMWRAARLADTLFFSDID